MSLKDHQVFKNPPSARGAGFLHAFTLIELLVVVSVVAILIALLIPAVSGALQRGNRAQMISLMRSTGNGMAMWSNDNNGLFPGPLWPGQVAEYDTNRDGRLVRLLAPYLGFEERPTPYVVQKFLPNSVRKATPGVSSNQIRVFVMNMNVADVVDGVTVEINPWGTVVPPVSDPIRRVAFPSGLSNAWAMSEAYRTHPAVVGKEWAPNTPERPPTGRVPLALFFDGSVQAYDPAAKTP